MKFWKSADVPARTILIRPKRALSGRFSFGMTLDWGLTRFPVASVEWCGARGLIALRGAKQHDRNLRLPASLDPTDLYVLRLAAPIDLKISMALHSQDAVEEDFELESPIEGDAPVAACADPRACEIAPAMQDVLVVGYLPIPARQRLPVFRVCSLRPFPEGALLRILPRRANGAAGARELMVRAGVGDEHRLFIIPPGVLEITADFHLIPQRAGEVWPVTLEAGEALEWSGTVRRGFDPHVLPAFSLEEM